LNSKIFTNQKPSFAEAWKGDYNYNYKLNIFNEKLIFKCLKLFLTMKGVKNEKIT